MCTFLNTLPKKSKTAGTAKRKSLVLSIKPCPDQNGEKTWYRFRLLNFTSKDSTREHPFIVRYVHQHWAKTDKGYDELENEVTCPMTDWMPWDGDRFDCPICKYANSQWAVLKESNYKNVDARKKNREFGRIFQAIIPVYVVNDPNFEGQAKTKEAPTLPAPIIPKRMITPSKKSALHPGMRVKSLRLQEFVPVFRSKRYAIKL